MTTTATSKAPLWLYGGGGDLYPDLTWQNRPDFAGSEAPEALQDAWVAIALAVGLELGGRLRNGSCYYLNLAGWPVVQHVLGEPVTPCAGYAGFVSERHGRFECGFRWRPDKWSKWIDADAARHLTPLADIHCWLETATHVIDLSTGDNFGHPDDHWPPLVYWPKAELPEHPRVARGRRTLLLWRNRQAVATMTAHLAPIVEPVLKGACKIAAEILAANAQLAGDTRRRLGSSDLAALRINHRRPDQVAGARDIRQPRRDRDARKPPSIAPGATP